MNQELCRWGFIGTAAIGRKNWTSVLHSGNGIISGVASRDLQKSQAYIDSCQSEFPFADAPKAFGSYEQLIQSDQVDAVYIPLPTGMRKRWVIQAAKAGKHVLCEKPCAINAEDLEEMLNVCKENNVQFMDGVMYTHSARLDKILAATKDQIRFGKLRRINGQFSFAAPDDFFTGNIRSDSTLEPHGCLGDLGWYLIRMALLAVGGQMPSWVSAHTIRQQSCANGPAVPIEFRFDLGFPMANQPDLVASFYCSFVTHHQQWIHFSGTQGVVRVQDFVLPYEGNTLPFFSEVSDFQTNGCTFIMKHDSQTIATTEPANSMPGSQESLMFRRFNSLVTSGKIDDSWPKIALATQRVMDACLRSAQTDGAPVRWA